MGQAALQLFLFLFSVFLWQLVANEPIECPGGRRGSSLFGCDGELWTYRRHDLTSPFIDWSYAGYQTGQEVPTDVPVRFNVVNDFGARGDNVTDDTQAFHRAISELYATGGGVLYIPAGVYLLSKPLDLTHSGLVLRGAGQGKTILYFHKSLAQIYETADTAKFNWFSGLVNIFSNSALPEGSLATVEAPAARGTNVLLLSSTDGIEPGSWVVVKQSHTASKGELSRHLFAGLMDPVDEMGTHAPDLLPFISKVLFVDAASGTVVLQRPLPHDVRLDADPKVALFTPEVHGVGIESLSITLADHPNKGGRDAAGWNAIFMHGIANCWVKDVGVHNAQNAISLRRSHLVTVQDVQITSSVQAQQGEGSDSVGHLALATVEGSSNLFRNFTIQASYEFDLFALSELTSVFSNGRAADLRLELHRLQPYAILFSDIDAGAGSRMLDWKGPTHHGACSAAYTTLWNIRTSAPVNFFLEAKAMGPRLNLIGLRLSLKRISGKSVASVGRGFGADIGYRLEPMPRMSGGGPPAVELQPPCLWKSMVELRTAREAGIVVQPRSVTPASGAGGPPLAEQPGAVEQDDPTCKYTIGEWLPLGEEKPLYVGEQCADEVLMEHYDCKTAPNQDFAKWYWKPNGCSMPKLNADYLIHKLRGRKLLYVGDSLLRNGFFAAVCIIDALLQGRYDVEISYGSPSTLTAILGEEEASKEEIRTLTIPMLDTTIMYVRSYFLCSEPSFNVFDCSKPDVNWPHLIDEFDTVVFNTGHHWSPKFPVGDIPEYKLQQLVNWTTIEDDPVPPGPAWVSLTDRIYRGVVQADPRAVEVFKLHTEKTDGHKAALDALLKYTQNYKGKLFYQTTTARHYHNGHGPGGSCSSHTRPWSTSEALWKEYTFDFYLRELDHFMPLSPRWQVLDILRLSNLRPDSHPSSALLDYKPTSKYKEDCSHFCLGSTPDTWFRLLLTKLN